MAAQEPDFEALANERAAELWHMVVEVCTKVLSHADIYGFELMNIPDPNVRKMAETLEYVICPIMDRIATAGKLDQQYMVKMINVRQYTLHLRAITIAIDTGDRVAFDSAIDALSKESMLL